MKEFIVKIHDNGQLETIQELIRCKDCRYGDPYSEYGLPCGVICRLSSKERRPDNWYCAEGKKRG